MRNKIGRRRFDDPRFGISDGMIEAERQELQRELDSYLLQSLTELRERSEERLRKYREQDECLEASFTRLPERERLALMCIFGRDLVLLQAVVLAFLAGQRIPPAHAAIDVAPSSVPFSEWLFAK